MKRQKSHGPHLGKLVHQLLEVVTFVYDIHFRSMIARWKGIVEERYLEKPSFRPSKCPWKLKPAKNSKLPKFSKNYFERVEKGGWPPISTQINPHSLGSNGIDCIEFPEEREKNLLDLHLGELLLLLETSHYLVCGSSS